MCSQKKSEWIWFVACVPFVLAVCRSCANRKIDTFCHENSMHDESMAHTFETIWTIYDWRRDIDLLLLCISPSSSAAIITVAAFYASFAINIILIRRAANTQKKDPHNRNSTGHCVRCVNTFRGLFHSLCVGKYDLFFVCLFFVIRLFIILLMCVFCVSSSKIIARTLIRWAEEFIYRLTMTVWKKNASTTTTTTIRVNVLPTFMWSTDLAGHSTIKLIEIAIKIHTIYKRTHQPFSFALYLFLCVKFPFQSTWNLLVFVVRFNFFDGKFFLRDSFRHLACYSFV